MTSFDELSVLDAVKRELVVLGPVATASVEGQIALNLAGVLDDRAGIASGGPASTAKRLSEVMVELRERFASKEGSRLELLRGGVGSAAG